MSRETFNCFAVCRSLKAVDKTSKIIYRRDGFFGRFFVFFLFRPVSDRKLSPAVTPRESLAFHSQFMATCFARSNFHAERPIRNFAPQSARVQPTTIVRRQRVAVSVEYRRPATERGCALDSDRGQEAIITLLLFHNRANDVHYYCRFSAWALVRKNLGQGEGDNRQIRNT